MNDDKFTDYMRSRRELIDTWLKTESKKLENKFEIDSHIFLSGGKRLRPILTLLIAESLDKDGLKKARDYAIAVEMMQSFSLAADDIIDRDLTRRGNPAAWLIEGVGKVFFKALGGLVSSVDYLMTSPRALRIGVQTLQAMARGALNELSELKPFTRDFLINTIVFKTAILYATSTQLGAIAVDMPSSIEENVRKYGLNLGIAYQIQDDLNDIILSIKTGEPQGDLKLANITYTLYLIHENIPQLGDVINGFLKKKLTTYDLLDALIPAGANITRVIKNEINKYIMNAKHNLDNIKDKLNEPYKQYLYTMPEYAVNVLEKEIERTLEKNKEVK